LAGHHYAKSFVCKWNPFASRIALDGSELTLSSQHAQAVSLLLHELITNAAKHVALKEPSGKVAITWIVDRSRHVLQLKWKEQVGPPVVPPRRTGFGTKLLKATFPAAQVDYVPDGVHCQIEIPITPGTYEGRRCL
jgi:two-component sensor histidine kinase